MKMYIAEGIGTFVLVFVVTGAIIVNAATGGAVSLVGIALALGLAVMTMVYAIGDVSGAHLNPAVTLGLWFAGKLPTKLVGPYIGGQFIGALVASLTLKLLFPADTTNLGTSHPSGSVGQSFLMEIIATAFLVFVVAQVAIGWKEKGLLAGVAIGAALAADVLVAGPISGASMNPARSLAPAIMAWDLADIWIYLIAPPIGGFLGAFLHRLIR